MGQSQTQPQIAAPVEEELDLADLTNYITKWKRIPANRDKHLTFSAVNPVTGAVERARFITMIGLDHVLLRWGRYFFEEPRFTTVSVRTWMRWFSNVSTCLSSSTPLLGFLVDGRISSVHHHSSILCLLPFIHNALQEVDKVMEASEPYNPYITNIQTVGYPIPIFAENTEAYLYDERAGEWVRGLIVGIEKLYYVFRPVDEDKLTKMIEQAQASVAKLSKEEEEVQKRKQRLKTDKDRLKDNAERAKLLRQQALIRLKLCIRRDLPPQYVRKNSALLRRVLADDPFFLTYADHISTVHPTFFDVAQLIVHPDTEAEFKHGFFLKLYLEDPKEPDPPPNSNRFQVGLLDRVGRMALIDAKFLGRVPAVTMFQEEGILAQNEDQQRWCEDHVLNWRDAHALLEEHRQLAWEELLQSKHHYFVNRTQRNTSNSLYAALSDQLFGTQDNAQFVRDVTLKYITKHKDYFQQFVDVDFEYYLRLKAMGLQEGYIALGDHLDIQAVCEIFDCCCELYSDRQYRLIEGRLQPYCSFYTELNATRTGDSRLPVMKLSYVGHDDYDSMHHRSVTLPLTALGGGVLGAKVSASRIIYNARKIATDSVVLPKSLTTEVVCHAGYVELNKTGEPIPHLRAIFHAAGFEAKADESQANNVIACRTVKITMGESAVTVLKRLGILVKRPTTEEEKNNPALSVEEDDIANWEIPGEPQIELKAGQILVPSYRTHFIIEGLQAHVDLVMAAMKNYVSPLRCSVFSVSTGSHRAQTELEF